MINVGDKVTIYAKGPMGISKHEGTLVAFDAHGVTFRGRRARSRDSIIMSYYSPFWAIVAGWGHPDPESAWLPAESSTDGVTVSRGRYRSTDPRWVDDFLTGAAAELALAVVYRDGSLETR